jgi:hypothetical protein
MTLTLALIVFVANTFAQGGRSLIVNHFVSDPRSIESHLVITDVDGMGPTITVTLYDNDGNQAGTHRELVPKFGKLNLDPAKYVGGKVMTGTIHITADNGDVLGEYWQFYKNNNESWKNTTTIAQIDPGYIKLACPHFVADPGVEAYLVIAAAEGKEATINVKYCDDNGREIKTERVMINANGKKSLKPFDAVKTQTTGVAYITAESGRITGEYWQAEKAKQYQIANPMSGVK